MIKTVMILRRKPGMSVEDFRTHYEQVHAPLTLECLPGVAGYRRLFVNPGPSPFGHPDADLDFDVVTEMTFASQDDYDRAMLAMRDERLARILREDQALLFDLQAPNRRFFATEVRQSAQSFVTSLTSNSSRKRMIGGLPSFA